MDLTSTVDGLMDGLTADLARLAAIPSIAFPGYPRSEVLRAHDLLVELLREAGVGHVERIDLPDTSPVIYAEVPPPDPDAPTVLLYGHYDVQPPGDESLWLSPPFEPTPVEGGLRARGIADDKSNVIAHLGVLRAYGGRPPTGLKIVIEGQEEYGSAFDEYPPTDPGRFACDAMVIADMGNLRPGTPTLTTGLRGVAEVVVEVRTLAEARHSGGYGGAAPDALLALVRALAGLHDENGDVAVPGLRRDEWEGASYTEQEFRELATVADGMPLTGSGSLGERLWSGPAITVIGLDAPAVDGAASAVVPYARARLNLRVHPQQDPRQATDALVRHLRESRPYGIELTVAASDAGPGFEAATGGPAYRAARTALREGWGTEPQFAASGGSIPLVNGLARAVPHAEVLLFGAQDSMCNLHAPNERVLFSELRGAVIAEAAFLREYAAAFRSAGGRR
ncbi:M20/M25/M40 family metallo-hydrolase [Streptomyces cocklensis]|uniref:Acetylornithine deacetylase/Succinyl-diaminopimelate desuccinylase n=1 Tax=Actinacidiphila cocklensis TaxID=887465 RepID=A0A9W4GTK2_9ACTN|nr:M20/M25/M40 family metallo-hydrolase [Actinacidiphila cocklensis]MDD1063797.1 M20/M25/M40 family metallo-hydrolase [Actinacidiphila cocklensis]CAG6396609.1 Acetylornithine deacetylase/Succinyl-diaminopimelate desuccinylase [Actinacidiphila cocklensis]